eukprot:5594468-Amphidinium_carterae.1
MGNLRCHRLEVHANISKVVEVVAFRWVWSRWVRHVIHILPLMQLCPGTPQQFLCVTCSLAILLATGQHLADSYQHTLKHALILNEVASKPRCWYLLQADSHAFYRQKSESRALFM